MYVIFPADEVVYLSYGRLIYVPRAQEAPQAVDNSSTAKPVVKQIVDNHSSNPSVPSTSTSSSRSFHSVVSGPSLSYSEDLQETSLLRRGGVEKLQGSIKSNKSWPEPTTSKIKNPPVRPKRVKKRPPDLIIPKEQNLLLQIPSKKSSSKSPNSPRKLSYSDYVTVYNGKEKHTTEESLSTPRVKLEKQISRENTPVNSDRAKNECEYLSVGSYSAISDSRLQLTGLQQLAPEKTSARKSFFGSVRSKKSPDTPTKMTGIETPLRDLTHPSYNDALKSHNAVTFKLVRTVSDFTQQLGQIYEQHAEDIQLLVTNFKKKNVELRKERPACPSSLFHTWETFLQEVEIDSQALADIASILGRQVSRPLVEKSFYRKIQSRKVFTHRESYDTIITKTEEKLAKCRQEYKAAYLTYLTTPTTESLSAYFNNHNAYVQQLHATNGMLEEYGKETLPQLLQELDEIYTDLCSSISEAILQGSEIVSARALERHKRYESLIVQSRAVSGAADLAHLARSLPAPQGRTIVTRRPFIAPQPPAPETIDGAEPSEIQSENIPPPLKDELVIDRLSAVQVQPAHDALRKESADLDAQIRQINDSLETLLRIQQRSLESALYNKANELQEDISMKKFDRRVAEMHLRAINSQKELFVNKLETNDSNRDRKMSIASTGSMKTKWLKAFKSLKTPPPASPKEIEKEKKNGSSTARDVPRSDPEAHGFQEYTYKKITPCDICSQILRGHTRQGLKCRYCKINVHVDCQEKASKCQPKSKLLRRQKSTSEIESRAAESAVEEESVENGSFTGMATFNRQLSFRDSNHMKPPQDSTAIDRRRGQIERVQGPTNTETSSMRRRIFAGMRSLTGFGSRSRYGSPSHRSISLPEKRGSQDASGTRPFGEPLCLLPQLENEDGTELLPRPPSPALSKSKVILKKSVKAKK